MHFIYIYVHVCFSTYPFHFSDRWKEKAYIYIYIMMRYSHPFFCLSQRFVDYLPIMSCLFFSVVRLLV